jgi:hypothetical protein
MKIASSNDDHAVVSLAKKRAEMKEERQNLQREQVIGPCPVEKLAWDVLKADILPDGRTNYLVPMGCYLDEETAPDILEEFHNLIRAVHGWKHLTDLPNGQFVRVMVEVSRAWQEHPLNPKSECYQEDVFLCTPEDFASTHRDGN